jgi:hypothetical protein
MRTVPRRSVHAQITGAAVGVRAVTVCARTLTKITAVFNGAIVKVITLATIVYQVISALAGQRIATVVSTDIAVIWTILSYAFAFRLSVTRVARGTGITIITGTDPDRMNTGPARTPVQSALITVIYTIAAVGKDGRFTIAVRKIAIFLGT